MVLIVEALTTEFAMTFWRFIEDGGYEARQRSNGKPEFYRFVKPKQNDYPMMIEIFARPGSDVAFSYTGHLVPLHIGDEISSLSAILLNEAYYQFLLEGRTVSNDISVLDAEHLAPMKMKAWLDLTEKRAEGMHVNERDIRRHRQDVFRLFLLIRNNSVIRVPQEVYDDVQRFIDRVRSQPFEPGQIGIAVNKNDILDAYRRLYKTGAKR